MLLCRKACCAVLRAKREVVARYAHSSLGVGGASKRESIEPSVAGRRQPSFFSVASLWEIAIKAGISKLDADAAVVRRAARDSGFEELPVLGKHVEALKDLPNHHRDPFDRLLVAQAIAEPMVLLTADAALATYGKNVEVV
jgi:PIN domain nuclease of toxin-antitoxin system